MKWKKKVSIWIVVSLSLQCLGLFYIDHYFLTTDSTVTIKKVTEVTSVKDKNININITVPTKSKE